MVRHLKSCVPSAPGVHCAMRVWPFLVVLGSTGLLTGCGFVHFGRLPKASDDMELQRSVVDLSVQRKLLRQELLLAHKETDTLRDALEHAAAGPAPAAAELSRQLESTTRELAALRVSYEKLKSERSGLAPNSQAPGESAALERKLAAATNDTDTLRSENTRLRTELTATRDENASLAQRLKDSLAAAQRVDATVAQLNRELSAQKDARAQAEDALTALKAQLDAVVARAAPAEPVVAAPPAPAAITPSSPATAASAPSASPASNPLAQLDDAKAPPSGDAPTVELRAGLGHGRMPSLGGATSRSAEPVSSAAPSLATTESTVATTTAPAATAAQPAPSTAAVQPASNAPVAQAAPNAAEPTQASSTPAAPIRKYKVQSGDTLEKLAVRFYGAADQWIKIYNANADVLSTNQGLKPGLELQIPEP